MKKLSYLLLLVMSVSLIGCETVRGMGKDLENTGDNIRDLVTGTEDSLD
jgi:predicted small secreted protein